MRIPAAYSLAGLIFGFAAVPAGFWLNQLSDKATVAHATTILTRPRGPAPVQLDGADWQVAMRFDGATWPAYALHSGWSDPEQGSGVWTSGRRAALRLALPTADAPVEVALLVRGFVAPDYPVQRVRVRNKDGDLLLDTRVTTEAPSRLKFALPAARGRGGEIELILELPDAAAPAIWVPGSQDHRELAIKLHSLAYGRVSGT